MMAICGFRRIVDLSRMSSVVAPDDTFILTRSFLELPGYVTYLIQMCVQTTPSKMAWFAKIVNC